MASSEWIEAFAVDELAIGEARVVRRGTTQIAVFRPRDAELFAIDNRCPHEGYPLAKGYVTDCVVTCRWHNFKFDLRDGRCTMGDEAVRVYPMRIRDGLVELDVTEPDPAIERARLLASLDDAMHARKLGQAARNIVRLLAIATPPRDIALAVAVFDARHGEFGTSHAMPLAVDVLAIAERTEGVHAVLPLMQAVDMASENQQRRPARVLAEPCDPGADPDAAGARLRALVEAEQAVEAEALLRGAIAKGWDRRVIEPWFFRLCADHFLDFGHALIYQSKIFDLLDQVGWAHADSLLPAHLFAIVSGTREDAVPEWSWFNAHLDRLAPELAALGVGTRGDVDPMPIADALLDAGRDEMMASVVDALRAGVALEVVVDALSIAAAHRILRFDVAIDRDPTVQEGWLDVTHVLTYTNALRHTLDRFRGPEVVRLVLFGCRFVHNARALDAPADRRLRVGATGGSIAALVNAIAGGDEAAAIGAVVGILATGGPTASLRAVFEDRALDDPLTRPIVVAHLVKMCAAAFDEHARSGRAEPLLALARFAASRVRERPIKRLCHEAIRFVVEGKVPRTMT